MEFLLRLRGIRFFALFLFLISASIDSAVLETAQTSIEVTEVSQEAHSLTKVMINMTELPDEYFDQADLKDSLRTALSSIGDVGEDEDGQTAGSILRIHVDHLGRTTHTSKESWEECPLIHIAMKLTSCSDPKVLWNNSQSIYMNGADSNDDLKQEMNSMLRDLRSSKIVNDTSFFFS